LNWSWGTWYVPAMGHAPDRQMDASLASAAVTADTADSQQAAAIQKYVVRAHL
jgi:hypothetical protein